MYYINGYNDNYSNYKYLVDVSDNYIVLSNSRYIDGTWQEPDTVDVVYFYTFPSFQTIETYYSSSSYREFDNISSQLVDSTYFASDFCFVIISSIIITFCLVYIFNNLTRIVSRGGVIFPK